MPHRCFRRCLLPLLLAAAFSSCHGQGEAPPDSARAVPFVAAHYRPALQALAARRQRLAGRYRAAATPAARAACLAQARRLLLAALDSTVFPAWAGTRWAFYGQSWEPRRGQIACGYFVTTALHDAGLRLARTRLAQQTSETIIKNLTGEAHIHRYRNTRQGAFVKAVQALGPGLYVVGLDFHVAFLRVRPDGAVRMVHSTYLAPGTVVDEAAATSAALASKYRVVGKLSADEALLRQWLLGQALPVRGAAPLE